MLAVSLGNTPLEFDVGFSAKHNTHQPLPVSLTELEFLLSLLLVLPLQQVDLPPRPRGFGTVGADVVVDAARVLSATTVDRLNRIAFEVHAKTGGEIAVVTMPDLRGRDISEISLRIGREWGIGSDAGVGSRERNAGVVVLVVPRETSSDGRGHVRIETGRGVEGFITDATAGDIQRAAIPYFQQGDYDRAVLLIVAALADRFSAEFGATLDTSVVPQARVSGSGRPTLTPGVLIFLLLVVFLVLSGLGRAGRRGRRGGGGGNGCLTLLWLLSASSGGGGRRYHHWGGGGFGGGSFGGGGGFGGFGGGGGFSGGGSSGSW